MNRLVAVLVIVPLLVQTPTRMRKAFISVDIEGITGVVQPAQLGPDGCEYTMVDITKLSQVLTSLEAP
jgi:hypothetical protein